MSLHVMTTKRVKLFERSIKLLATVVPEFQKTADLVQEISAATEEHCLASEQINPAMQ
ncbi:hypothetical protein [Marinilabilia sp.]|uniref:hypothetical protein n=1 Tax=Marinilabilia sp. TaxID=2021252 RepID=UPI0025BB892A|nr:hypothetical protein [Marinilabilia sp.]